MSDVRKDVTLNHLRTRNMIRCAEWHSFDHWSLADRLVELAGEVGEACNIAKKLRRIECGMVGENGEANHLRHQLAAEFADALISLDIAAAEAGIDLDTVVRWKFNETSRKHGLKTMFDEDDTHA